MKGLDKFGNKFNPCTWPFGDVLGGVDCNQVNPVYMYSGDPVTQYGWINTFSTDQRQFASTGPFRLELGKPVTIIVAHIVGRGTDYLNSITVSRDYSSAIQSFYESNFTSIPVSVEDTNPDIIADKFELHQNYPNPFNPMTNIRFRIGKFGFVSLKVYDILGREVAALVNEEKPAGSYEVIFDGSGLGSGLYFYQLKTREFVQTKKAILLK
jgi:hypothetical protein